MEEELEAEFDMDEIEEWDNEDPLTDEELKDIAASLPIYPPLAEDRDISFVEFLPQMSPDELKGIWEHYKKLGGEMDYDNTKGLNKSEVSDYMAQEPTPTNEDEAVGLAIQAYEEITGEELGSAELPEEYIDEAMALLKLEKWEEAEHPRAKDGKFGDKGGGEKPPADKGDRKPGVKLKGTAKEALDTHPKMVEFRKTAYQKAGNDLINSLAYHGYNVSDRDTIGSIFDIDARKTDYKTAYKKLCKDIVKDSVDIDTMTEVVKLAAWKVQGEEYRFTKKLKAEIGVGEPKPPEPKEPKGKVKVKTPEPKAPVSDAKQKAIDDMSKETYHHHMDVLYQKMDDFNVRRKGELVDPVEIANKMIEAKKMDDPYEGYRMFHEWCQKKGDEYEASHGLRKPGGDSLSARLEPYAKTAQQEYTDKLDEIEKKDWTPKRKAMEIPKPELEGMLKGGAKLMNDVKLEHHSPTPGAPPGGINDTFLCDVQGDGKAFVKPVTAKSKQYGGPANEMYAYDLSEALGFGVVPTTQYRDYKGVKASAQSGVEDAVVGEDLKTGDVKSSEALTVSFSQMMVLDAVSINCDRHDGNWMYQKSTGKIVAIDNGFAGLRAVGKYGTRPEDAGSKATRWVEKTWTQLDRLSKGSLGSKPYIYPEHIKKAEEYVASPEYEKLLRTHFDEDTTKNMLIATQAGMKEFKKLVATFKGA